MPCDLLSSCFDCPKLRMHLEKRALVDAYLMYYTVSAANQEIQWAVV